MAMMAAARNSRRKRTAQSPILEDQDSQPRLAINATPAPEGLRTGNASCCDCPLKSDTFVAQHASRRSDSLDVLSVSQQMADAMSISPEVRGLLRCPICQSPLTTNSQELACTSVECGTRFPIVRGVPILLNESTSVFSISDFRHDDTAKRSFKGQILKALVRRLPENGRNTVAARNYAHLGQLLIDGRRKARVLVVGGSIVGSGMEGILAKDGLEFVETDVVIGARTQIVCDAHDLPFADQSFDGVVIQAVLEHVADPYRAVAEIHRVLKGDGLVYAETPFMQQVHEGRHDFTRFTHLGHRRLFRNFAEIESGAVGGPGMALAWSYEYFLLSFFRSRIARGFVRAFSRLTGFWLKYFDEMVRDKPGAIDASSGHYFLGRRSDSTLSDRDLITLYRGPQNEIRV